jgi:hypothetical protein
VIAASTTLPARRLVNYIIPPVIAECSPATGGVTQNIWTSLDVQSLLELHPSGVQ